MQLLSPNTEPGLGFRGPPGSVRCIVVAKARFAIYAFWVIDNIVWYQYAPLTDMIWEINAIEANTVQG